METMPDTPTRRPRRRRAIVWIAGTAVVLAAVAGFGIWWFLKDDAPPEANLETAVESLDEGTTPAAAGEAVTVPAGDATESTSAGTAATDSTSAGTAGTAPAATPGDVSGTWTVDTSVGTFSFEDSTGTFVGFRVEEELSGIGSATAVGRTPEVSGTLTIDGTTVTAVSVEAAMDQIVTNDSRRDDRARGALEIDEFPVATFVLTQPIELGQATADGQPVRVTAVGELTVHGTTNAVEIPLEAQLVDDVVVVVGSVPVVFADYGVSVPSAPIVVSAADHGIIELQLFFSR